jgi:hypothetical protein
VLRNLTFLILSAVILLFVATSATEAKEVRSITVRGATVAVGDTADELAAILRPSDVVREKGQKDLETSRGFYAIRLYKVDGREFALHFARLRDPGPFEVIKIVTTD